MRNIRYVALRAFAGILSLVSLRASAQNFIVTPSTEIDFIHRGGETTVTDTDGYVTVTNLMAVRDTIHYFADDSSFDSGGFYLDPGSGNYRVTYRFPGDSTSSTVHFTDGQTTVNIPVRAWSDYEYVFSSNNYGYPSYTMDFGHVPTGSSRCYPLSIRNATNTVLVIDSIQFPHGWQPSPFILSDEPSFPLLLLSGEKVVIANICFNPIDNNSYEESGVSLQYHINNQADSTFVRFRSYPIVDTFALKPCLEAYLDSALFGPVLVGGSVTVNLTIYNNRKTTNAIVSATLSGDAKQFSIGATLPLTIPPLSHASLPITFTTHSNDSTIKSRYIGTLQLNSSSCDLPSFVLPAVTIEPTDPNIPQNLFPDQQEIIAMVGGSATITKTFFFVNNSGTKVKVTSVGLKSGKSFSIVALTPGSVPFTLNNGDQMSVTLTLNTTSNDVYYDELVITTEQGVIMSAQGTQTINIPIQGLRSNEADVPQYAVIPNDINISLVPNPALREVSVVTTAAHIAIEIYDLLGNLVAMGKSPSGLWQWNGILANGQAAPSGSYIVRVSGIGTDLRPFVKSESLMIK